MKNRSIHFIGHEIFPKLNEKESRLHQELTELSQLTEIENSQEFTFSNSPYGLRASSDKVISFNIPPLRCLKSERWKYFVDFVESLRKDRNDFFPDNFVIRKLSDNQVNSLHTFFKYFFQDIEKFDSKMPDYIGDTEWLSKNCSFEFNVVVKKHYDSEQKLSVFAHFKPNENKSTSIDLEHEKSNYVFYYPLNLKSRFLEENHISKAMKQVERSSLTDFYKIFSDDAKSIRSSLGSLEGNSADPVFGLGEIITGNRLLATQELIPFDNSTSMPIGLQYANPPYEVNGDIVEIVEIAVCEWIFSDEKFTKKVLDASDSSFILMHQTKDRIFAYSKRNDFLKIHYKLKKYFIDKWLQEDKKRGQYYTKNKKLLYELTSDPNRPMSIYNVLSAQG